MNSSRDEDFEEAVIDPTHISSDVTSLTPTCCAGPDVQTGFSSLVDWVELRVAAIFLLRAARRFKRDGKKQQQCSSITFQLHNLKLPFKYISHSWRACLHFFFQHMSQQKHSLPTWAGIFPDLETTYLLEWEYFFLFFFYFFKFALCYLFIFTLLVTWSSTKTCCVVLCSVVTRTTLPHSGSAVILLLFSFVVSHCETWNLLLLLLLPLRLVSLVSYPVSFTHALIRVVFIKSVPVKWMI